MLRLRTAKNGRRSVDVRGGGGSSPGTSARGDCTARRADGQNRKGSASPSTQTEAFLGRGTAGSAGNKRSRHPSGGVPATRTSVEAAAAAADESRTLAEDEYCPEPDDEPVVKAEVGVLSKVNPKGKVESHVGVSAEGPAASAEWASRWGPDASVDTKVEISCPRPKRKIARGTWKTRGTAAERLVGLSIFRHADNSGLSPSAD